MPELPEVETVKNVLEPQLCGRRIAGVALKQPQVLAHPGPQAFCGALKGARFAALGRRGKYLLLELDTGDTLLLHLRMTGRLLVTPGDFAASPHTHLVLRLEGGRELRFIDPRRFGRLWLRAKGEPDTFSGVGKLGPEPLTGACSAGYLAGKLQKRRIAIKQGLLDQAVVAGIGNIYASEILFAAGLYPGRPASALREPQWQALARCIPAVLRRAIEENAITAEEYLATQGKEYRNTPFFQVYGREGDACPRCGTPIARIQVAGRSSFYCPGCQGE